MSMKTGSGQRVLADPKLVKQIERIASNVVGGALDGETFPSGTRDGQQYRWNAKQGRWVYVGIEG